MGKPPPLISAVQLPAGYLPVGVTKVTVFLAIVTILRIDFVAEK